MAIVSNIKRIIKEDFESDEQDMIGKLAEPINSFAEKVKQALNGSLDFNNLNQQVIQLTVSVDSTGIPIILTQYKSTIKTRVIGHSCIAAVNESIPQNSPINTPFISFTQNGELVKINKITGLQTNQRYLLTVISIGANIPS
jgi:hypothetical protein